MITVGEDQDENFPTEMKSGTLADLGKVAWQIKAHHRVAPLHWSGRSTGSIERKYQNIFAAFRDEFAPI